LVVGLFFAIWPFFHFNVRRSPAGASPAGARKVEAAPGALPKAAPALSDARQLADRAFAMSVDSYDSTLDDYVTAEALLKRALALDPNDGEILARSAQLNLMSRNRGFDYAPERIATGHEQAERAIRLAPDSPEALMALSLAQRYTGNRDGQLETLRRLVTLAPDHARGLLALGATLTLGGINVDEGLAFYRRASQQPKWAPLADYYEFLRFWDRRDFSAADAAARRSYSARPSANSAGAIAMLHLTWKGDLDEAARELAAVPPTLVNTPRVVWLKTQVHLSRRAPDAALSALDRLSDEFIRDSWFVGPKALLAGRAHALAGRMNAARLAWEAGLAVIDARLKSDPADGDFRRARGELLAWLGRDDEALQEARTLEEINRGRLDAWNKSSATIYGALGRADLAVPLLEKMLTAQTNWPLTVTLLKNDPLWDKLRNDARFAKLLAAPDGKP
jgi:tetratricopeptide (TPR) repeat protein